MAYAFNNDKTKVDVYTKDETYSKSEIISEWVDIPVTGAFDTSSILKYRVNADKSITIVGNIDMNNNIAAGVRSAVAVLPESIRPKRSIAGGFGNIRSCFITATVSGLKRIYIYISIDSLYIYNFDAIVPMDYVCFEYTYNPENAA